MLLFVCLTLISTLYAVWLYMRYQTFWRHLAKIPGPKAYPIVGNLLHVGANAEEHLVAIRRWCKDFNFNTFVAYGGPTPYLIVLNPKHVDQVLSSSLLTYKDEGYHFLRPWLGDGLLTSNHKVWLTHRKMITPSFHFSILTDFLRTINETVDRFMLLLDVYATKENMFDFQQVVQRCTMDIICETAMGVRVNTIEGMDSPIATAMTNLCRVVEHRAFSVIKRSELIFRLTSDYQIQTTELKIIRRELFKIINKRRELLNLYDNDNNNTKTKTNEESMKRPKMAFLDNLIKSTIDGKHLTAEEIFHEVSTFMFEGHDTTATALTFAIFCLSRHPEVQAKVYEEQFQLYGNDVARSPTYTELQDMKYLELVIKETLRLFPSVPMILRTVDKPTMLGELFVPKGVTIMVPIIAIGTNERIHEHPFKFWPERFESRQRTTETAFDYVPFSAGPRNCIGQKFAMMELKVTISKIVRNFHILPAVDGLPAGIHNPADPLDQINNPYDPRLAATVTLSSVNGAQLRLKKRLEE